MTIYGPGLGTLWRLLDSYGIDPRRVISESDYSPGEDAGSTRRLSFEYYDRLRTRVAELVDDPLIGLRSAEHIHPSHFGALGYAWMASATLLTGLHRLVRYGRMFNEHETWSIEEGPREITLTAKLSSPARRPAEVADALIAGMTALCRMNFGMDFHPEAVTLRRDPPRDPGPWFSFFRCPVSFSSDADRLVLSRDHATKPLAGSDPQIVAVHDRLIERALAGFDRNDVVNRTRVEIIDQLPSGDVTEDSVARALNMTTRTLHRKLRTSGESFRTVLTGVRKELAQGYLSDPTLSLTEIAFLLGYSDSSAFSRAVRRWFGRSPSEMRAAVFLDREPRLS